MDTLNYTNCCRTCTNLRVGDSGVSSDQFRLDFAAYFDAGMTAADQRLAQRHNVTSTSSSTNIFLPPPPSEYLKSILAEKSDICAAVLRSNK